MESIISIILPVYNVEKYITKSIQSVLNQTQKNFELLVINDGTKDNSINIVRKFKDSRIKIFNKENGGLSDARNFGLKRAKGKYVYFMDSDDWIEPNLIEDCIDKLESEKLNLIVFGYVQDNENKEGELLSSSIKLPEVSEIRKLSTKNVIDNSLLGILGYAWNKVYRRDFLVSNNIVFEKGVSLVEDILFNTRVYEKIEVLRFINKPYYHYLNRPIKTLIKTFHKDSFQLKLKGNEMIERFLMRWHVESQDKLMGFIQVQAIIYCINNLFSFRNNLSFLDKIEYIRMMVYNSKTRKYIRFYKPSTFVDTCYKVLICLKCYRLIGLLAFLKK